MKARLSRVIDATHRVARSVFVQDWRTKLAALAVTLLVFIVTRDDIERRITVPLRTIPDPDRVLVTSVPDTVELVVRGHWSKVGRLRASDLGDMTIDLRTAAAGPVKLDPTLVVPPEGARVERIESESIDLRFDPVVERSLPLVAPLTGSVHRDYEIVSVTVDPNRVVMRGGEETLATVQEVSTERVSVAGATGNIEATVAPIRPHSATRFERGGPPRARVTVEVRPRHGERVFDVSSAWLWDRSPDGDRPLPAVSFEQQMFTVVVSGPIPMLAELRQHPRPVQVELDDGARQASDQGLAIRFVLAPDLPARVRSSLVLAPERSILRAQAPGPATPMP